MLGTDFHPLIQQWFTDRFGEPTEPQRLGWPRIAAGEHTLIAAPTGSGKTLAAFLVCLDRLVRDWYERRLDEGIRVVYVSPLKALSNDIERNLQRPLAEIRELAEENGLDAPDVRAAVRTGDTPSAQRQRMLRKPPHILVTTPESLYLLLTSEKSRDVLRGVDTVIVDEIHALARDKRGSHLALTLERLDSLCERKPTRIGLSATQRPIEQIGRFLVGSDCDQVTRADDVETVAKPQAGQAVHVIDGGHARDLDLAIDVPPSELSAVCSHEQWGEVYERLTQLIASHRSTLIFVNTRRLAERVSHHLRELLGEDAVAGHHGSLSREIRLSAEQRLKNGELKAIVATASLEMGIDIGYIDLVCQIGSPRSIAAFLQRVGRSGHSLGLTPKGRMFPLTRDELLEAMALVRAVHQGELDRIEIPEAPLDILAQQVVASVACEEWNEDDLFETCRRAYPYRDLTRKDFDEIVEMLATGATSNSSRGRYLHRDRINSRLRARRGARLAALTSGGAIPEQADYRVVVEPEKTFVGTVDEDFAIESLAGDVFLLGNTSWRVVQVRSGEVIVQDAEGAPPNVPFWFGEGPGRTIELSAEVSLLRRDIAEHLEQAVSVGVSTESPALTPPKWLRSECGATDWAAEQSTNYVHSQVAAIGLVPTRDQIVFERFFDESGGMQLVIHSPLGSRINRAWGLALRKRFCRSFDFELQAAATDDGIVLSLSPQHSFPIDALFKMLGTRNGKYLLEQALLAAPMFQVRWRWNITRALAVLRQQAGKRVPPHLQRFRSDDLLASAFPETVGCLENHHGDVEIPDHPLVRQTMHDCLTEAMDLDRWLGTLGEIEAGKIELIARDTREPSPFCHELLNANPYAFLDDAPLEERRTRAVSTRRSFTADDVRDLAKLDPAAIAQVRAEAWPTVRDADELHDALLTHVAIPIDASLGWDEWFDELVADRRATRLRVDAAHTFWIATEQWPLVTAIYDKPLAEPAVDLPEALQRTVEPADARTELVRGRIQTTGPISVGDLARELALTGDQTETALEALEGKGIVLRGSFIPTDATEDGPEQQWCDRRLLARIHRLTLEGLREQIKPVSPADFMRFLIQRHRLTQQKWSGPAGVREAIGQLQGFELPAGAWEDKVLSPRCSEYDSQWLDQLFLSGEATWGRLQPPRREDNGRRGAMTRAMPVSLLVREDLAWLVPPDRQADEQQLSSYAQQVVDTLRERGALFFQELKAVSGLLPAHIEDALRELAAVGLINSDAFAAVRTIAAEPRGRGRRQPAKRSAPAGRWSLFPIHLEEVSPEERTTRWCRQLLRRYGVVFRDLLTRESAAPPWRELAAMFRRMEMRGEVRGGRFVSGVAGEQFAEEAAVGKLRAIRDEESGESWTLISAADPLNLVGIVLPGTRVPATRKNSLVLQAGRCVAAKESGSIAFFEEVSPDAEVAMRRALQTGRMTPQAHIKEKWQRATQPAST